MINKIINRASKTVDAVSLNLFNDDFCNEQTSYDHFDIYVNENQLCAGIPSQINGNTIIAPFKGKHKEDFGGPLICIDEENQKPILTGIGSTAIDFAASDVTGL